jgi:phosphoribosylformylglycinamidine synthase II
MELVWNGETVADIPLDPLADEAPLYERPYAIPKAPEPLTDIPESTDIAADLLKLMGSPALASRRWVWEQYDQSVGADTVQRPGGDAAVVRVHGSKKALAITTDCTPRYCYADPVEGGKQAVAEAYRNLCAVGARPLAITNCLNFGNPQRPEIMGQFVGCIEGIAEACRALDFPVVSGNVSLYNETKGDDGTSLAILPTPAIGGVGLLDDWEKSATIGFKSEGEHILLISVNSANVGLGQSLWLQEICGRRGGPPPPANLSAERHYGAAVRRYIEAGLFSAVHDISDGGMLVALAEMALASGIGAEICLRTSRDNVGKVERCFGEGQSSYLATVSPSAFDGRRYDGCEDILDFLNHYHDIGLTSSVIGTTAGTEIVVYEEEMLDFLLWTQGKGPEYRQIELARIRLADLRAAHEGFFPRLMGSEVTPEF